jgi:hypothetical protein
MRQITVETHRTSAVLAVQLTSSGIQLQSTNFVHERIIYVELSHTT